MGGRLLFVEGCGPAHPADHDLATALAHRCAFRKLSLSEGLLKRRGRHERLRLAVTEGPERSLPLGLLVLGRLVARPAELGRGCHHWRHKGLAAEAGTRGAN